MMNNMGNLFQRFQQFRQMFRGDPRQQVQNLLNSGKVSQAQYNNAVQTVPVPQPVETEKQNVLYTRVLGDTDSTPSTGDNSFGTTAAVMIAAASLFILILCRKSK